MTREQAIALCESNFWKDLTSRQIAEFQIMEERLCMPFEVFHKAIEQTLGRPVLRHELVENTQEIRDELFGSKAASTLEEIINMIPEEKRIIILC